jgi:hypothetical protein
MMSRILRLERPLLDVDVGVKKKPEIFRLVRDYISDFGKDSYDILEMELYERIDDEIYFPSSLCVVGTFNFPEDSRMLTDWSFRLPCFRFLEERPLRQVMHIRTTSLSQSAR